MEVKLQREWVLITMISKDQVEGTKKQRGSSEEGEEEEDWIVVEKNQH
jgi:hypothetical protein